MLPPFSPEALEITREKLRNSGTDLAIEDPRPWLEATGCERRAFILAPASGLLRLAAVTALWQFRLLPDVPTAKYSPSQVRVNIPIWPQLEPLLEDLLEGRWPTSPLPQEDHSTSAVLLMLSLAARRLAMLPEHVEPFATKQKAADALAHLDALFGDGLFGDNIFWMLGALADIGLLSPGDAAPYRALPTRSVREALFRLGLLETPYASDLCQLVEASKVLSEIYESPRGDIRLLAFVKEQGCASPCPWRRHCSLSCRERSER